MTNLLPDEETHISKTQRKRDMGELQALGEDLASLAGESLRKIALPDDLRDAITAVHKMTRQDEARRRQMQYIGKLMRSVDAAPLREAMAKIRGQSAAETARLHRLEQLRTKLLDDEKVLQEIYALYPHVDLQYLRSLRRAALREKEAGKPPKSYRAIYQVLNQCETELSSTPENPAEELASEDK